MNNIPMRKCVGCGESKPKDELVRITYYDDEIKADFTGKAKGRGIYVCPNEKCIRKAEKKNGIQRSLKKGIDKKVIERIVEALLENEKKEIT